MKIRRSTLIFTLTLMLTITLGVCVWYIIVPIIDPYGTTEYRLTYLFQPKYSRAEAYTTTNFIDYDIYDLEND